MSVSPESVPQVLPGCGLGAGEQNQGVNAVGGALAPGSGKEESDSLFPPLIPPRKPENFWGGGGVLIFNPVLGL